MKSVNYYLPIFILLLVSPFISALATDTWHFLPSDVTSLHSDPANARIHYGKGPLQFADLRLPKGKGPFPVAIIVHGGCWVARFASYKFTSSLSDALRRLRDYGIATYNIEYRREDNQGGGWPGTFNDVAHAADYLRIIAKKYSLNLKDVIVVGHSAGGHLALWLAARHNLPKNTVLYTKNPLQLRGVLVLDGVPNLKAFRQQGINTCEGIDVVGKLLGNTEKQISEHYKYASPSDLLPLGVPQILIFGRRDTSVPPSFGSAYTKLARKHGDKVKFITIPFLGHHGSAVPNSLAWKAVRSSVLSLLNIKKK